jgi:hypothetical protein
MNFHQNVGTLDRWVRMLGAASLTGLALAGIPAAPAVYASVAVAIILAVTAISGFCPLYALFGLSTRPVHR